MSSDQEWSEKQRSSEEERISEEEWSEKQRSSEEESISEEKWSEEKRSSEEERISEEEELNIEEKRRKKVVEEFLDHCRLEDVESLKTLLAEDPSLINSKDKYGGKFYMQ